MVQVSIIVPVYNAEHYIERCVNSILNQNFTDFELILIDDGSTDGSGLLCDQLMETDNRINVVHQKNGGASSARNKGICEAKGEFLCFVDADDFIGPQYVNDLYQQIYHSNDIDLVIQGIIVEDGQNKTILCVGQENSYEINSSSDFFRDLRLFRFCGPCSKMFKRTILNKMNYCFDTEIICAEDFDFISRYLLFCKSVYLSSICNYHYVKHRNSVSSKIYSFEEEILGLTHLKISLINLLCNYDNINLEIQIKEFLAYYVTRVVASLYKKPRNGHNKRVSNLKKIDDELIKIYCNYYKPTTTFMKLIHYLLSNKHYGLMDMMYSIATWKSRKK